MRSMLSAVRLAKSNSPVVGLFMIVPARLTSVGLDWEPGMGTGAVVPGPPVEKAATPWASRSASMTDLIFLCSSSSPVMTSTALVTWLTGSGVFVALTITSSVLTVGGSSPRLNPDPTVHVNTPLSPMRHARRQTITGFTTHLPYARRVEWNGPTVGFPDSRIIASPRLPVICVMRPSRLLRHCDGRNDAARYRRVTHSDSGESAGSLPAYSGGTVMALDHLPLAVVLSSENPSLLSARCTLIPTQEDWVRSPSRYVREFIVQSREPC